jgi:hypothetical protein
MDSVVMCVGAVAHLSLLGAVFYQLQRLPLRLRRLTQHERAEGEHRALDALQAAAATRVGGLVVGLRAYHDHLSGAARAQLADAEVRARVSERRTAEAGVVLDAASALVRDLRALAEDPPSLFDRRALQVGIAIGEANAQATQEEAPSEDELTRVQDLAASGARVIASVHEEGGAS